MTMMAIPRWTVPLLCETDGTPHQQIELSERTIMLIDEAVHESTETCLFAMGCFWRPDALFGGVEGVVKTCVGYAGGTTYKPTYEKICDHIESIEIVYDTEVIAYDDLLEFFWVNHDPRYEPSLEQYSSAIFPIDVCQSQKAKSSLDRVESMMKMKMQTQIIDDARFWPAENIHQKHRLRQNPQMMSVFKCVYSQDKMICNSTAAARYNSIASGHPQSQKVRGWHR